MNRPDPQDVNRFFNRLEVSSLLLDPALVAVLRRAVSSRPPGPLPKWTQARFDAAWELMEEYTLWRHASGYESNREQAAQLQQMTVEALYACGWMAEDYTANQ